MRTMINALVTEKSLAAVAVRTNAALPDILPEAVLSKQVCCKVDPGLSDDMDTVCDVLKISKRRFMEAALSDAVESAFAIMKAEGVPGYLFASDPDEPHRQEAA